jgi:hypothetical protein
VISGHNAQGSITTILLNAVGFLDRAMNPKLLPPVAMRTQHCNILRIAIMGCKPQASLTCWKCSN